MKSCTFQNRLGLKSHFRASLRQTRKPPTSIHTTLSGSWEPSNAGLYRSAGRSGRDFSRKPETKMREVTRNVRIQHPQPTQNPSRTPRIHPPHFLSFLLYLLPSPPLHHPDHHATPLPELRVSITSGTPVGLPAASPPFSFNPCPPISPQGTTDTSPTYL
jgi:hypothetical protein